MLNERFMPGFHVHELNVWRDRVWPFLGIVLLLELLYEGADIGTAAVEDDADKGDDSGGGDGKDSDVFLVACSTSIPLSGMSETVEGER